MHILFFTEDERYLAEGTEQREFLNLMTEVTESLHAVVLTNRNSKYTTQKIGEHTWVYPTNSLFPFLKYFNAQSIVRNQVMWKDELHADLILSDDPKLSGWLGMHIAAKFGRVWMVNLHTYYWEEEGSMEGWLAHYFTVPKADVFKNAFRIITFSERLAIYTQTAAKDEEQKAKVVIFPQTYTTSSSNALDVKVRHPQFNFVVLMYLPKGSGNLSVALQSFTMLHHSYQRSGLVVMVDRAPTKVVLAEVALAGLTEWVVFEVIEHESLPFSNANIYLYMNGGEAEDSMLIRVAAAGTMPIVAAQSVVSERLLNNNVNGLIVYEFAPAVIATAIRKLNEVPGLRELFRVNAGLLLQQEILPSREALLQKLREYFTFAYEERPSSAPGPEKQLFADLTKKQPLSEKLLEPLKKIKDHYTKLRS